MRRIKEIGSVIGIMLLSACANNRVSDHPRGSLSVDIPGMTPVYYQEPTKAQKTAQATLYFDWANESIWGREGLTKHVEALIGKHIRVYDAPVASIQLVNTSLVAKKRIRGQECGVQIQMLIRVIKHDAEGKISSDSFIPIRSDLIRVNRESDCSPTDSRLLEAFELALFQSSLVSCGTGGGDICSLIKNQ